MRCFLGRRDARLKKTKEKISGYSERGRKVSLVWERRMQRDGLDGGRWLSPVTREGPTAKIKRGISVNFREEGWFQKHPSGCDQAGSNIRGACLNFGTEMELTRAEYVYRITSKAFYCFVLRVFPVVSAIHHRNLFCSVCAAVRLSPKMTV